MSTAGPLRLGILSTAHINEKLLAGAALSVEVDVVAVGSRELGRARAFADRHGIPAAYGSYDELLADAAVEAIYNPLPNTLHCEWSIRALEAGKHVLCEKPLSSSLAEVEGAFDVAERTGLLLAEAFMYRHHPQIARLRELVAAGAIGELRLVRATFSYGLFDEANIRLRTDVDGGALMDVGCYCISGARVVAGEPISVSGRAFTGPTGTDWVFTGSLQFPGDVIAIFDCGTCLADRDELEVVGTRGSLFLDDPWHGIDAVIELRREGGVERIEVGPANAYQLELEDLARAVRTGGTPLIGRADAVCQARVIEALRRSAADGRDVEL